jgi:hypothetical protein
MLWEQSTTSDSLFYLTLLLRDTRGRRPAPLALFDPRLDGFWCVELYVRALDRDGSPA